ncbi:DNA translocase FtsK [Anaerobranca californiensis DSM 14826]|uniref:DNA translocase FtsK n=1 Tax=Anaerobranca californiensis DSM 14826 TaxID=1120989 RepID=A0A1M6KCL3_9FIRM|nr:DNA translocase FtsK [Anaerobranca californiensis]SHJ56696.1 DNA translocase FtsK [Anaerobranca californiensis DSM 14826]
MQRKKIKKINKETNIKFKNELKAIIFATIAGLSLASLIFTDQVGKIGQTIHRLLFLLAGKSSLFIPFLLLIYSFKLMFDKEFSLKMNNRVLGIIIFYWTFLLTNHVVALFPIAEPISNFEILRLGLRGEGGGILGALLSVIFLKGLGVIGTFLTAISFLIIGMILILDISIAKILKIIGKGLKKLYRSILEGIIIVYQKYKNKKTITKNTITEERNNDLNSVNIEDSTKDNKIAINGDQLEFTFQDYEESIGDEEQRDKKLYRDLEGNIVVKFPPKNQSNISLEDKDLSQNNFEIKKMNVPYTLPPLSILQKPSRTKEVRSQRDIEGQAKILLETLQSFGVSAKITHIHRGPTITRFELQPAVGVKVSKILSLSDDLALSLAATGIRIEAPIPGKAAIGIEVPNTTKATVYLREVIETKGFLDNPSKLTVALGKDIAGEPLIADFTQMPHILIAGATGSGKSVCVNTIIASILFKATPDEVRFLMVDPKVVELNVYNGIPHLLAPVVTDPKNAAFALKKVVKEMESRYELFAKLGVRDINRYNAITPDEKLPFIVVIIDELADLMMVAPRDVEDCICRLAQMARASGIHLIVATQRPSVDVITGVIKANITSRIAFAVSSGADSRTILDMGGAEKLLGKGDMLYYPVGAAKPIRAQSSYISDEEVEKLVSYVKQNQTPEYDENFEAENDEKVDNYELDELFNEAAQLVVDTKQASISLLQRRFRIGYNRAARIIDDLEKMGIVGGFEGSKARRVLITSKQLEEILK